MRKRSLFLLPIFAALMCSGANAGWEYAGTYVGDGAYRDDGSRFVLSVRGGASLGMGTIENKIGSLVSEYFYNPDTGIVVSRAYYEACADCTGFVYAGMGDMADLKPNEDFSAFAFAAGASLGWTMPNRPQWRIELGWDHITESEYNTSPLFTGDMALTGGDVDGLVISIESGGVQSKVTTDIVSVMAFYDFFDGLQKPLHKMIPYVGFGLGYADTKTVLNLSDLYGDLSTSADLQNFGTVDSNHVLQFYRSETSTSNISALVALGLSYGIAENMFLDLGARVAYLPKITWALSNEDDTRHRDWFSANNMIYANIMLGLRFEF